MPFEKVTPEKLSHSIIRQIELLILRGVLRPGERLPSERELSERMGVSRPSLREALAELVERGLLTSRAGAGVYVASDLESAFPQPLIRLFATHDEAVFDYLAFRKELEGRAAERAARLGSDTDLKVISAIWEKMQAIHTRRNPAEEARLDANFHLSIVEASHNLMALHVMRSLVGLLTEGAFYNRQQMFRKKFTRDEVLDQHREIHDALHDRDPERARRAVEDHISYVERRLKEQRKSDHNERIAQLRFSHENSK